MCICIYVQIQKRVYIYIYMYIHVRVHICIKVYTYIYTQIYLLTLSTFLFVIHLFVRSFVHLLSNSFLSHMYIYIYTHKFNLPRKTCSNHVFEVAQAGKFRLSIALAPILVHVPSI